MVRGWARGVEEYRERKASTEIQERSNLCDHGCIPITALTLDSGRWFNGGSLFLLTSPFSPTFKTENTRGLGLCGRCGQGAKIYSSLPHLLVLWLCHCVGLLNAPQSCCGFLLVHNWFVLDIQLTSVFAFCPFNHYILNPKAISKRYILTDSLTSDWFDGFTVCYKVFIFLDDCL